MARKKTIIGDAADETTSAKEVAGVTTPPVEKKSPRKMARNDAGVGKSSLGFAGVNTRDVAEQRIVSDQVLTRVKA